MAVGPGDLDGVVADQLGVGEDGGLVDVGRQDGQRERGRFGLPGLALGAAGGAGAALAEVGQGVMAFVPVGPLDREALAAVEVQVDWLELVRRQRLAQGEVDELFLGHRRAVGGLVRGHWGLSGH